VGGVSEDKHPTTEVETTPGGLATDVVEAPPAHDQVDAGPAVETQEEGPVPKQARPARHARPGPDPVGDPDVPTAVTGHYLPSLDGLRAVAMLGILVYHLNPAWLPGGYLAVDLFFVLSGFLITSLLLEEWARKGRMKLSLFWARRARRLLPALFLALLLLILFIVLDGRYGPSGSSALIDLPGLRGDGLATLFYFANWHFIFSGQSYFGAHFATQSPLLHTWTLAIEEQFYLVWPPILLGLLYFGRRHWRRLGLGFAVVGAVGSAVLMAVLYHSGHGVTRVYFGTDTRAFDLLAGIAVAMVAAARPQPVLRRRHLLHVIGIIATVALGVLWATAGTVEQFPSGWMFRGGFLLAVVFTALVIADVRQLEPGPVGRLLAIGPLRWFGTITYGFYLFHWPVIVYLNPQRTGLNGAVLNLARVALTLVLAVASFYLVERPIRRSRISGWPRFVVAPVAALGVAVAVVIGTLPAVAAPSQPTSAAAVALAKQTGAVSGAGGYAGQTAISLPPGRVPSRADPLRVMFIGDSVMYVAEPGIRASLEATHDVTVAGSPQNPCCAYPGWGLSTDHSWRTGLAALIRQYHPEIILATWSWDDGWAVTDPAGYKKTLEAALGVMLAPGDGVDGLAFVQFPKSGPDPTAANPVEATKSRVAGQVAWAAIAKSMTKVFPGKVMYLPVASSILLGGRFSPWLPPAGAPHAPQADWVRVRMVDNMHLCPAGVVRYADALLVDLQHLFKLSAATSGWNEQGWINDQRFWSTGGQDACPPDHPPG